MNQDTLDFWANKEEIGTNASHRSESWINSPASHNGRLSIWTFEPENSICFSLLSHFNHGGSTLWCLCMLWQIAVGFPTALSFIVSTMRHAGGPVWRDAISLSKRYRWWKDAWLPSNWQGNNAAVLFAVCFDTTSLSVATHWVAYSSGCTFVCFCRSVHTPPLLCASLWMQATAVCVFWNTRSMSSAETGQGVSEAPFPFLPLSCHTPDVWLPKCQAAVLPCNAHLFSPHMWKSSCLLEILFLAGTSQPDSREK